MNTEHLYTSNKKAKYHTLHLQHSPSIRSTTDHIEIASELKKINYTLW